MTDAPERIMSGPTPIYRRDEKWSWEAGYWAAGRDTMAYGELAVEYIRADIAEDEKRAAVAAERVRLVAQIEAKRRHWFCSGDHCEPYDHGRDEGFEMALAAIRQEPPQ
jgi:hypothetical protein